MDAIYLKNLISSYIYFIEEHNRYIKNHFDINLPPVIAAHEGLIPATHCIQRNNEYFYYSFFTDKVGGIYRNGSMEVCFVYPVGFDRLLMKGFYPKYLYQYVKGDKEGFDTFQQSLQMLASEKVILKIGKEPNEYYAAEFYNTTFTDLLEQYLHKYINTIKRGNEFFKTHYDVVSPIIAYKKRIIPKTGEVLIQNLGYMKFNFHGWGCDFIFEKELVGFDYDSKGIFSTVSPYHFYQYIKSVAELPESLKDISIFHDTLLSLEKEGRIIKDEYYDYLINLEK